MSKVKAGAGKKMGSRAVKGGGGKLGTPEDVLQRVERLLDGGGLAMKGGEAALGMVYRYRGGHVKGELQKTIYRLGELADELDSSPARAELLVANATQREGDRRSDGGFAHALSLSKAAWQAPVAERQIRALMARLRFLEQGLEARREYALSRQEAEALYAEMMCDAAYDGLKELLRGGATSLEVKGVIG
jgi:hypothetical protein